MIEKLKRLLFEAIKKCYENDKFLINQNMERPAVARIFYYMQSLINSNEEFFEFLEYNLDTDYNKKGLALKITARRIKGTAPDLILHKRDTLDNLLVVEFKSAKARPDYIRKDKNKLEDFTKLDVDELVLYRYQLGVFIKLNTDNIECSYFQNGREVDNVTIPMNSGANND